MSRARSDKTAPLSSLPLLPLRRAASQRSSRAGPLSRHAQLTPPPRFAPSRFSKKASAEKKAAGLVKEINNGRLAQIGIMGCLAESKVEGAVPAIAGKIAHYDGDYMAPFEANFHLF